MIDYEKVVRGSGDIHIRIDKDSIDLSKYVCYINGEPITNVVFVSRRRDPNISNKSARYSYILFNTIVKTNDKLAAKYLGEDNDIQYTLAGKYSIEQLEYYVMNKDILEDDIGVIRQSANSGGCLIKYNEFIDDNLSHIYEGETHNLRVSSNYDASILQPLRMGREQHPELEKLKFSDDREVYPIQAFPERFLGGLNFKTNNTKTGVKVPLEIFNGLVNEDFPGITLCFRMILDSDVDITDMRLRVNTNKLIGSQSLLRIMEVVKGEPFIKINSKDIKLPIRNGEYVVVTSLLCDLNPSVSAKNHSLDVNYILRESGMFMIELIKPEGRLNIQISEVVVAGTYLEDLEKYPLDLLMRTNN